MDFMLEGLRKSRDTRLPDLWSVRGEDKLFLALHDIEGVKDFQDRVAGLKLPETRRAHRSIKLNSTTSAEAIPVLTLEDRFEPPWKNKQE